MSGDLLEGGYASSTYRVRTSLGRSVIVKTHNGPPPELYSLEADGLNALRVPGAFAVPAVLRVAPDFLVQSDLDGRHMGTGATTVESKTRPSDLRVLR
ncbi:hypothetical protein E1218_31180 [Kribbella turkmenica]|uniref:Aminoglycoside phosphotransferase domain-containing protein n=1 Tax=Kribbella turkmenica TaxID=2530375 RepID=A0A4R4WA53_9ACTN|nr:hypothetical protein [Kribbella turkmenica]TDD15642.1 hypothetical protein E1218_31180 [Kribbella turkmenica]